MPDLGTVSTEVRITRSLGFDDAIVYIVVMVRGVKSMVFGLYGFALFFDDGETAALYTQTTDRPTSSWFIPASHLRHSNDQPHLFLPQSMSRHVLYGVIKDVTNRFYQTDIGPLHRSLQDTCVSGQLVDDYAIQQHLRHMLGARGGCRNYGIKVTAPHREPRRPSTAFYAKSAK